MTNSIIGCRMGKTKVFDIVGPSISVTLFQKPCKHLNFNKSLHQGYFINMLIPVKLSQPCQTTTAYISQRSALVNYTAIKDDSGKCSSLANLILVNKI